MTANPHPSDLLEQLRVAVNADHRRRSRQHRMLTIAFLVVAALSGGAWAAATQTPWWQSGGAPIDPAAVASVARDNMPATVDIFRARTVAKDGDAALVAVPLDLTGYCLIPTLGGRGDLGAQCEYQVTNPQQGDDDRLESYAQPAGRPGGPAWIVYGRITDPRAAAVELGSFTLTLQPGGFFLGIVPQAKWPALDGTANPGMILDASGATVRTGCVNWGASPTDSKVAGSDTPLWQDDGSPCRPVRTPVAPTLDYGSAKPLFDVTLHADFSVWKTGMTITFWQAPASNGEQCVLPGPTTGPDKWPGLTGDCQTPSTTWPATAPTIHAGLGAQLTHVDHKPAYIHETEGRVDPSAGIVRIALHSPSGDTPVSFGSHYFFVQIPGTSATADALPDSGPLILIGYDASGHEVASVDLNALNDSFQPH